MSYRDSIDQRLTNKEFRGYRRRRRNPARGKFRRYNYLNYYSFRIRCRGAYARDLIRHLRRISFRSYKR